MSLDNRFRVSELMSSGSRAIVSQDPVSKAHTFYADSKLVVSGSTDGGDSNVPFTHIKGERDGELIGYVEKPAYIEQDLKRAVDTVVDELIAPPKPERPDVVPRPVYDALEDRYQQTLTDLEAANETIRQLQGEIASLQAQLQATLVENDSLKVQKAVVDNQFQQQVERYKDMTQKVTVAIVKAAKEANDRVRLQATVEGLNAQKDVLRQQLLSTRQLVLGLTENLELSVANLEAQQKSAEERAKLADEARKAAEAALTDQIEQQTDQLEGKAAEIGAGAVQGGTTFTARVLNIRVPKDSDITYSATRSKFEKWANGPEIVLLNYTDSPTTITFTISNDKLLNLPSPVTLAPGEKKTVSVIAREPKLNGGRGAFNPNAAVSARPTTEHKGTITMTDSNGQKATLSVSLFKSR